MFTHDQIWTAIDRLADSRGLSASGLARQAGLDPTAFNRSKRISPNGKPRWPSTESLAKILAVTDCTMADLLAMMEADAEPQGVRVLSFSSLRAGRVNDKHVSMLRSGFDGGPEIFAVHIEDDRLHPLFREGSTLVADPQAKVKTGDRILAYTKKDGLKGGVVQSMQKKTVSLAVPGNEDAAATMPESDIVWMARILWASQ